MMNGIVRRVYESPDDNYYHMVLGDETRDTGETANRSDEQRASSNGNEFKLVKKDTFLELTQDQDPYNDAQALQQIL